jgi:spore coat protein CotF
VIIKELIVAAAQGAADGIGELQTKHIEVELQEFEIEVNYSCTTELTKKDDGSIQMDFMVIKAEFSTETSYKRTTTYGLKVRFVFTGKKK